MSTTEHTSPAPMPSDALRLEPMKAVKVRVGLSQATIYRLLAAGRFPKPHRRVGKRVLWLSTDIDAWILSGDVGGSVGQSMGQAA